MTAPKLFSADARRRLLSDLATLKSDDDAVQQDPKWFLPLDTHVRALRLEILVVRGGRGAGKSSLFHFVNHLQLDPTLWNSVRAVPITDASWFEGYSGAVEHPSRLLVGDFAKNIGEDRRRFFWFAWLCARLSATTDVALPAGQLSTVLAADPDPGVLADCGKAQLVALTRWMDDLERSRTSPIVVTYDGLDRIGSSSRPRREMTASLLAMWLSLADRYRKIRPKIFVREDLFQDALSAFPDASKLVARSVSLEWRVEDLYRVLIKHMANSSEALKEWVETSSQGIALTGEGALGWMPPALPENGPGSQKEFADNLAGELMGSGDRKGFTYRWIPNHLQDAHARVVPRSILSLVRNAAELALKQGPAALSSRLLTPQELQGALERTSKRLVDELKEEFPVVERLEQLRGKTVMLARKEAIEALGKLQAKDDEHGADGEQVLRTLIDLGVMSERTDGRIDVPDIYRYEFGILRKGGVKRLR